MYSESETISCAQFDAEIPAQDPRDYIPFLTKLQSLPEGYQKFKIDEHLERWEKALENLSRCGDDRFDEAKDFIKAHRLYNHALQCFAESPEKVQVFCYFRQQLVDADSSLELEHLSDARRVFL